MAVFVRLLSVERSASGVWLPAGYDTADHVVQPAGQESDGLRALHARFDSLKEDFDSLEAVAKRALGRATALFNSAVRYTLSNHERGRVPEDVPALDNLDAIQRTQVTSAAQDKVGMLFCRESCLAVHGLTRLKFA